MNNIEEQNSEIEVLQSIYQENFKKDDENNFHIYLYPNSGENNLNKVGVLFTFSYNENYPEEMCQFSIQNLEGLIRDEIDDLKQELDQMAQEMKGNVYIFNLCSFIQEHLIKIVEEQESEDVTLEKIKKEKELELSQINRFTKDSEFNQNFTKGTQVTKENFAEWKSNFEKEVLYKKKEIVNDTKLTGKQLFEQKNKWIDETMIEDNIPIVESEEVIDDDLFLE